MTIIGISMALSGLPQGYRIWKRKTSDDISISLWIILLNGVMWWFVYGITIGSISLIITNSTCLVLDSIVLFLIIRYKKVKRRQVMVGEHVGYCYYCSKYHDLRDNCNSFIVSNKGKISTIKQKCKNIIDGWFK